MDDGWETSDLPERYKLAIRLTDAIVVGAGDCDEALRNDLAAALTPPQIVELALTAAMASAFSKAAIAWGPPPDMPPVDVPTPTPDPADRYR